MKKKADYYSRDDALLIAAKRAAYRAVYRRLPGEDTLKVYQATIEGYGFEWVPSPINEYMVPAPRYGWKPIHEHAARAYEDAAYDNSELCPSCEGICDFFL